MRRNVVAVALVFGVLAYATIACASWVPNGVFLGGAPGPDHFYASAVSDDHGGAICGWWGGYGYVARISATGEPAPGWTLQGESLILGDCIYGPFSSLASDGEGGAYVVVCDNGRGYGGYVFDSKHLYVQRITPSGGVATGWPQNGEPVTNMWLPNDAAHFDRMSSAVNDGASGVFIAWNRGTAGIQSIGPDGVRRWGANGLELRSSPGLLEPPVMVPDRKGGVFVFWRESGAPGGGSRLWGQHLSALGEVKWANGGIAITDVALTGLSNPSAVFDADEGVIVSWAGTVGTQRKVFVAQLGPQGFRPWGRAHAICPAEGDQSDPHVVMSNRGGAVIVWIDARVPETPGIYAQYLDRRGIPEWSRGGKALCVSRGTRGPLVAAPDGEDGAYVAWGDNRAEGDLYATRMTAQGTIARRWARNGTLICTRTGLQAQSLYGSALAITATGRHDAILFWNDDYVAQVQGEPFPMQTGAVMLLTPDGPAAMPVVESPRPTYTAVPEATTPLKLAQRFVLHGVAPNPATRGANVSFALPDATPVTIEFFDVAGRRVWSLDAGPLGAGEHSVHLGGTEVLAPGVYLVRLRQGERMASVRVAITR